MRLIPRTRVWTIGHALGNGVVPPQAAAALRLMLNRIGPEGVAAMTTTPGGVPIRCCPQCKLDHPIGKRHCDQCGRPSTFIRADGLCVGCHRKGAGA